MMGVCQVGGRERGGANRSDAPLPPLDQTFLARERWCGS